MGGGKWGRGAGGQEAGGRGQRGGGSGLNAGRRVGGEWRVVDGGNNANLHNADLHTPLLQLPTFLQFVRLITETDQAMIAGCCCEQQQRNKQQLLMLLLLLYCWESKQEIARELPGNARVLRHHHPPANRETAPWREK